MAGIVCYTGASIITQAREIVEQIGTIFTQHFKESQYWWQWLTEVLNDLKTKQESKLSLVRVGQVCP